MCSNETHTSLSQPEHFMRHSMAVERACALTRRGLGSISIEQAQNDARDALSLADRDVTKECARVLHLVIDGDLQEAARLQSI